MGIQKIFPDQIFGYDVNDNAGNKVGSVDNVWIDDDTNELEFIGVKTGMIFGKTHVVPTANANITDGTITVPFAGEKIKDAPSFPADRELSPTEENEIYSYYGDERSMQESDTGLAEGGENVTTGPMNRQSSGDTGHDSADSDKVILSEEKLNVEKRNVEAGRVRLRKVVNTKHEEVPVQLYHEQVEVERVDASETDVPTNAFQQHEIEVPVMREEPLISKEAQVSGGVRLNKTTETETRTVGGDVQSEDVVREDNSVKTDPANRF